MKKLLKKKVNVFGKGIPVFAIFVLGIALVSAALISYWGTITGSVVITQGLFLDGKAYESTITDTWDGTQFTSLEEKTFVSAHSLENTADVDAEVKLAYNCVNNNCDPNVKTVYYTPSMEEIIEGADRLVATQNIDGGWDWGTPDGDPSNPSPKNTIGVTAQGVLDAYVLTGNPNYLASAIDAYDYMVVVADAGERIRGPDIPFLVELSEVTGESKYATLAETRYTDALTYGSNTATSFAEYIRDARVGQNLPALVSWDINLYVQGALALDRYYSGQEYDTDADAMTEVIYEFMYGDGPGFDIITEGEQDNYILAVSGTLDSFNTAGIHSEKLYELKRILLDSQLNGFWIEHEGADTNNVQATAYAVMALINVGETTAVVDGANWLVSVQLDNGGWNELENTEVTSEVLQTGLFTELITANTPFTVPAGTTVGFVISNHFPQMLFPDTYTITTTVEPVTE